MMNFLKLREKVGLVNGFFLGAATAAISFARQSRMFHPRGVTYLGHVSIITPEVKLPAEALLRFSSAWWKKVEWIDVLGVAIRFSSSAAFTETPKEGDQDLLFATIRHPWTLPFAPFTTQYHDFLANEYFTVSPFQITLAGGPRLVEFRLVPSSSSPEGAKRKERLCEAVKRGAHFNLEFRELKRAEWIPAARIDLTNPIALNQELLQFSPFRVGAKIEPRGYIHFLRVGAYRASQWIRPKSDSNSVSGG